MLPNDLNSETSYLKFKDSLKQWLEPKFIYFFFINFNHTIIQSITLQIPTKFTRYLKFTKIIHYI